MEVIATWWNATDAIYRLALGLLIFGVLLQFFYLFRYYVRIILYRHQPQTASNEGVSVVICARNEERNLRDLIPRLMEQNHPNFELVVVDDSSWDDTTDTLRAYTVRYPNLHVVHLDEDKQRMSGKKFALTVGIKGAKHDIILLTDADCVPVSNDWISRMTAPFGAENISVVLGVSPYGRMKGMLNRMIRFDAAQVAATYLSFALAGVPYMGVGRNLAYRKSLFFKNSGFKSHLHIASGDDDLFIGEVATAANTAIVFEHEAQTISDPKTTWKSWIHQKRRHFSTAPHYRASRKIRLALWPLSWQFMWLGAIVLLIVHSAFFIVGAAILLRYIAHFITFSGAFRKMGLASLAYGAPIWESMIMTIHPFLWIWNQLATPRTWK
jgi:cellulose synthase/poly-beta-1,6-N-acetylglucosamine synthase-like glycosyltransferase